MTDWINSDGLKVPFGPRANESGSPALVNKDGVVQTVVFDIGLDGDGVAIPVPDALNQEGSTNQPYFVNGDFLVDGWVVVETLFTGATTIDVGLKDMDGTLDDVDYLTDTAPLDVDTTLGAKALVFANSGLVTGITNSPAFITAVFDATPTAGKGRVIINFIPNRVARATAVVSETV